LSLETACDTKYLSKDMVFIEADIDGKPIYCGTKNVKRYLEN
jgi:hypothetical protein